MRQYRIVEKENCYGDYRIYVQKKGILWGWNYVKDLNDMIITFRTKEFALKSIKEWYGCKYNKIVNITEVSNEIKSFTSR